MELTNRKTFTLKTVLEYLPTVLATDKIQRVTIEKSTPITIFEKN